MKAKQSYGNVHLVTDTAGAKMLEPLALPYDSVTIALDKPPVDRKWWIWGKIVAYKLQREPFFHIDGDVYLWNRLPVHLESVPLLAQSFETPENMQFDFVYGKHLAALERSIPSLPKFWKHTADNVAINAGIFGGTNIDLIKEYATQVEAMLIANTESNGWANVCLEQQMAYCAAKDRGLSFIALLDHLPANQNLYTHACSLKRRREWADRVIRRVSTDYPEFFHRALRCGDDAPTDQETGAIPRSRWPRAARLLAKCAVDGDKGIGDVVARWTHASKIDRAVEGSYRLARIVPWLTRRLPPCGCADRRKRWNAMYPLAVA